MIELLRDRRSVRKFTDEPVSEEERRLLSEALLRSPSSRGINPWQFVFVDDPELLAKLSTAKKHGGSFLGDAPLAVVVCGDPEEADTWIEDCSIASILLQLTAQSLGLGSCWVQVRMRKRADGDDAERYVREVLGIPDHLRVLSIVAIGRPAEEKQGHPAERLSAEKISENRFL